MGIQVFGDVVDFVNSDGSISYSDLEKIISMPTVKPRFRISVLRPDDTIDYEIPSEDIVESGISYTEEYQNGQRRNISLQLINSNGKYTPNINGIWLSTKFRFDIGLEIHNQTVWFPRGVYIMGDVSLTHNGGERTINIQLKDKFAILEGKMGTLENSYEIERGSNIPDVIKELLHTPSGDGYCLDYSPPIFDAGLINKTTQSTIRVEEGGNLGEIIQQLAMQLSAEYYYNNVGNLCFYPIEETINDITKPTIWVFKELSSDVHTLSLNYKNEEVVNCVKVVGDNIDGRIHYASLLNENPSSPICVQRVGKRAAPKYNESNIWSDELAYDLAEYYLRQSSFLSIDFSCTVNFNPILTVNNICEVENEFLDYEREKLLITSLSYSSGEGSMSLKLCNTSELPQNKPYK